MSNNKKVDLRQYLPEATGLDLTKSFVNIHTEQALPEIHYVYPKGVLGRTVWRLLSNVIFTPGGWSDTGFYGLAWKKQGEQLWTAAHGKMDMSHDSLTEAIALVCLQWSTFYYAQFQLIVSNIATQQLRISPQSYALERLNTIRNFSKDEDVFTVYDPLK